jgi:hypothetical protein
MKKAVTSALLFFALTLLLSTIYLFMLPESSEQVLQSTVADTSDIYYHQDEQKKFSLANDKKIAEELATIHQSELMNASILQHAIKEFGIKSKEDQNVIAMKKYETHVTQEKNNGRFILSPVKDENFLNQRRKEIGLEPIELMKIQSKSKTCCAKAKAQDC